MTDEDIVDDAIDKWHNSKTDETLIDFLGLTYKQYEEFVREGKHLKKIVKYLDTK